MAAVLKEDASRALFRVDKDRGDASALQKTLEAIQRLKGLEKLSARPDGTELEFRGAVTSEPVDVILLWQTLRDHGYRLAPKK